MKTLVCFLFLGLLYAQAATIIIDSGSAADIYVTGGTITTIPDPLPPGVTDATHRFGNFRYRIPCITGIPYIVEFNWVEQTVQGPGQRRFQITINNQIIFDQLDLFSLGGYMAPISRSVVSMCSASLLDTVFTTQLRNAIIGFIKVTPFFDLAPVISPQNFVDAEVPAGAVDGLNVTYTLNTTPSPTTGLKLYRNGMVQKQGFDYTISGSTITFVTAATPQQGDTLLAFYRI